jgi:dTDP-4-dehydrorhamnose 3,5-epimerase
VALRPLVPRHDRCGSLTELYRRQWPGAPDVVQWSLTESEAGVLRGVHVHARHADWIVVLGGAVLVGLHDLRAGSASAGSATMLTLEGRDRLALHIAPGVAHGFYCAEASVYLNGATEYWDPADELGCRWDDPGLGLDWPLADPVLSERDRRLPSLAGLLAVASS